MHHPPTLPDSEIGIRTLKRTLVVLLLTAAGQGVIVVWTGSVALLADTVHNIGDACSSLPLWLAFILGRRAADKRFTFGYGRAEDLAGAAIVGLILISAAVTGYQSVHRLMHPQEVSHLGALAAAAIIGFAGNELVAVWRIRVGKRIGSVAMIADGRHARIDGLTSLAVLAGAIGVWMGYPLADPIVGICITVAILGIARESAQSIFTRMLDGVDPEVTDQIRRTSEAQAGVREVTEVRVRWLGHALHAELNIAVDGTLSVVEGHRIAVAVRAALVDEVAFLSNAIVHVDPHGQSGERFHDSQSP
jgi:cation diffusion facilitator family transporter